MDESKAPGIRIEQILMVRAAFEHRADFLAIPTPQPLNLKIQIRAKSQVDEAGSKGLILMSAATEDDGDQLYKFDIEMAALVSADADAPNMPVAEFLKRNAPAVLMPFLRQAVADITGKGRFGPLYVNPLNLTLAPPKAGGEGEPKQE